MPRLSLSARFWSHVDRTDGPDACWPWAGRRRESGHGQFKLDGKCVEAHRVAYMLATGQAVLPGIVIRHRCSNAACCRPDHLVPGSQFDNVQDRVQARRSATGERNGRAKLTAGAVRQMRQWWRRGLVTKGDCARMYGVTVRAITFALDGDNWAGA